jgi:peroxiredoxin family protein
MSAAQFKDVSMLFTYGAIRRLVRDKTDEVGDETDAWFRKDLQTGLEKGSIKKISEMISYLKGFGGKIYACSAAMTFHDIDKDTLIDEVDGVTGISTFLEQTDGAQMLYV